MLSRFILNFPAGVTASDGNAVCLSFTQDLHKAWHQEALVYIVSYKFIIPALWSCQKVLHQFKELDSVWFLFKSFFWPFEGFIERGVWKAQISSSAWEIWNSGLGGVHWSIPQVNSGYVSCILFPVLCIWAKMYERHKRRYSLCDISKVDRTVDVVLLKVRGQAADIAKLPGSFMSVSPAAESPAALPCTGRKVEKVVWKAGGGGVRLLILRFLEDRDWEGLKDHIEPLLKRHFACFKMHS